MVNPIECKLLHKKTSLAVLSDERNAAWFNEHERRAIDAHIPWTRRVEERRTQFHGQPIDLIPFVLRSREQLVLKPSDDYGGAGIALGWEVDTVAWEAAVRNALARPYIVQERIMLPFEPYPSLVDGSVRFDDRMLDTAPFVVHGESVDGCLTRLSTAALLNVTPAAAPRCRRSWWRSEHETAVADAGDRGGVSDHRPCDPRAQSYITEILNGDQMLLGEIKPELHQSMVEIGTRVCRTPAEVRAELVRLRGHVMQLAGRMGWSSLRRARIRSRPGSRRRSPRWSGTWACARTWRTAQQLLIFGTHVHIGIEDRDFLIDAMNVARYFVPHVLTLSTSSPFWMGRDTGLKSYRSIIFRNFPRSGIPPVLDSGTAYAALVDTLVRTGCVPNGSKIWWDVRPNHSYPTLEFRSVTSARGSTRPSAWPRSCRLSSPSCGSCGATT